MNKWGVQTIDLSSEADASQESASQGGLQPG